MRRNHLYKEQLGLETHGEAVCPGKEGPIHSTDELTRLRRENGRLREEGNLFNKPKTFRMTLSDPNALPRNGLF